MTIAPTPAGHQAVAVRGVGIERVYGSGRAARRALAGCDLSVARGEIVTLFGPSGSGKSTLLGLIGALDRGFTGQLEVLGVDLARASDAELSGLRSRKIGFVFQAFHLLSHLTVAENVALPALFDGLAGRDVTARAQALLTEVGLAEYVAASPSQLSGGQRQRVAIARALWNEPELLLCDEPTGNLDRATGDQIVDLFAEVQRRHGGTLVIVTHEERILRIATRRVDLLDGRVSQERA